MPVTWRACPLAGNLQAVAMALDDQRAMMVGPPDSRPRRTPARFHRRMGMAEGIAVAYWKQCIAGPDRPHERRRRRRSAAVMRHDHRVARQPLPISAQQVPLSSRLDGSGKQQTATPADDPEHATRIVVAHGPRLVTRWVEHLETHTIPTPGFTSPACENSPARRVPERMFRTKIRHQCRGPKRGEHETGSAGMVDIIMA